MHSTPVPIMPFVILILLLLPIRLAKTQLKSLAFFIWLVGGTVLLYRGFDFLTEAPEHTNAMLIAIVAAAALAIGYGKGKFVLSKTSRKNIERINEFTEPKKPIQVYSLRSWIMISLMVGISLALTWLNTPLLVRGAVNLGIGFGLVISSLAYLKAVAAPIKPEASVG